MICFALTMIEQVKMGLSQYLEARNIGNQFAGPVSVQSNFVGRKRKHGLCGKQVFRSG